MVGTALGKDSAETAAMQGGVQEEQTSCCVSIKCFGFSEQMGVTSPGHGERAAYGYVA